MTGRGGPTIDLGLQSASGLPVPKTESQGTPLPSNRTEPTSAPFLETPSLWACPFPHTQPGYQLSLPSRMLIFLCGWLRIYEHFLA